MLQKKRGSRTWILLSDIMDAVQVLDALIHSSPWKDDIQSANEKQWDKTTCALTLESMLLRTEMNASSTKQLTWQNTLNEVEKSMSLLRKLVDDEKLSSVASLDKLDKRVQEKFTQVDKAHQHIVVSMETRALLHEQVNLCADNMINKFLLSLSMRSEQTEGRLRILEGLSDVFTGTTPRTQNAPSATPRTDNTPGDTPRVNDEIDSQATPRIDE